MSKEILMKQAKELGIVFSNNITEEKLNEKIQMKLSENREEIRSEEVVEKEVEEIKEVQGTKMVNVACKIPSGINFNTPFGLVEIKGVKTSEVSKALPYLPSGTYAITPVLKDAWDYIVKHYSDQPFMKNKVIFAKEHYVDAVAQAKELDGVVKSGFEQLDPTKMRTKKVEKE